MKRFKSFFLFVGLSLSVLTINAQLCDITASKIKGCRGDVFQFSIISPESSYYSIKWEFGDGKSSTLKSSTASYIYNTIGTYTVSVTLYSDASGTIKCGPKTITIDVYDLPNADLVMPVPSTMCYKVNFFQFIDNSYPGKSGAPITSRYWDFGDGGQSTNINPLHSYMMAGAYTIYLTIADSNGCFDTVTKVSSIKVLPDLAPKFKTKYTISCPATPVKFDNLTDSNGKYISGWWWDFGDGTGDSSMSNWNMQFTHIYKGDGSFNPKLVVQSGYGCKDSFIVPAGARNIYYSFDFDIKTSTPGPVCWEGNNVCFTQKPRPNAYYWLWTFDDPPSQNLNTNDLTWTPCHKYTAPGFYHLTLKIWEPSCIRDTTICAFISVKGPQAMIKLPPPAQNNTCEAGKKIPVSAFEAAYTTCWNPKNDPIPYTTFQKVPKYLSRTDSFYCNAPVVNIHSDLKQGCHVSIVTKINYTLGNAQGATKYYDSIVWYSNVWNPGDPYPWVNNPNAVNGVYYPPKTACNYKKNMHDTDQYISNCRGPNLVFFPNNSVKYRLRYDIDNNPLAQTIPPGKDMSMDKCKNPSYPWSSDSMQHFWDFGDSYGTNCTSTVSVPNARCKYSTEITPYHNYEKSGCYVAKLTVTDTAMKCISTATVSISMEPPDAGWDYKVFKQMALAGWDTSSGKLDWATQLQMPPAWGRRGMILNGIPCVGQAYPQRPAFNETLPSCGQQKWWMVFDSAYDCAGYCKDSLWVDTLGNDPPIPNKLIKTKAIKCGWIDDQTYAMMGNKYIYSKGGCKTVGLIIKTGDCIDTFWYSKYKYIADLQAGFDVLDPVSYNVDSGRYLKTLDYGADQHHKLCPPFKTILTVSDTQQTGITKFIFNINKNFGAPWTKAWNKAMEDSCKLVQMISYMLCHKDSFVRNPNPPYDTTWTNCFTFPNPGRNCGVNQQGNGTIQDFLARRYFIKETYNLLDLRDTLYMNDSNGNSLFQPGKYGITSIVRNIYNCYNLSQRELFVGYYTDFVADDQIICYEGSGNKVIFNGEVRYFKERLFPSDHDLNPIQYWRDPIGARGGVGPASPSIPEKIDWDLNGDGIYGDGATTKPDSVSYVYTQPGNYTIRMRTTDSNNCTQILERKDFIKVIGILAGFDTANALSACAPQTVQFIDTSYGLNNYQDIFNSFGQIGKVSIDSVISWQWDFGDHLPGNDSKSNLKNPIHTYSKNGCYDVTLSVQTSNGCTNTIVKTNYICLQGPLAGFKVLDSVGYAPYTVFVKDRSSNTTKWEFVKGDNTTDVFTTRPADSTFALVYKTPGTYYLYLRATDSFYNSASGKWIVCIDEYGETYDNNDPHFKITVYPNSIDEAVKSAEFFVYPNPFTESVNVFMPPDKAITEIQLLDLSGKSVQIKRNIRGNNMEILREGLPQGIYILKIVSDKVYVFKLMAE